MNSISYSIIIPHYSSLDGLRKLLESIPNRKDIQVLVIDDCSPDDVQSQLKTISTPNLTLIFNDKNKGAGHARNIGIKNALGKWMIFADSDDYFLPNAFSVLDEYCNLDIDVLYYNVSSINVITLKDGGRNKNIEHYIQLYQNGIDSEGYNIRMRKWEPWNKMIRSSYIHKFNFQFEEIKRCNDMAFGLSVGFFSNKISTTLKPVYCVTWNPSSITRKRISDDVMYDCVRCEIRKKVVFSIIGHPKWSMGYLKLLYYIVKNLRLGSFSFLERIISNRRELQDYKKQIEKYYLENA